MKNTDLTGKSLTLGDIEIEKINFTTMRLLYF